MAEKASDVNFISGRHDTYTLLRLPFRRYGLR